MKPTLLGKFPEIGRAPLDMYVISGTHFLVCADSGLYEIKDGELSLHSTKLKEGGEDEDDDSLGSSIFCINRVKDSQYLVGSSSRVVLYDLERRKVLKKLEEGYLFSIQRLCEEVLFVKSGEWLMLLHGSKAIKFQEVFDIHFESSEKLKVGLTPEKELIVGSHEIPDDQPVCIRNLHTLRLKL